MKKKILFFVIIFVLIIAVVFFCKDTVISFFGSKEDVTTVFFLKDSNDLYALFNDDGKKLTDFEFTDYKGIIGNNAVVMKEDLYGIVGSNGKMIADFGKYEYITKVGKMFKVEEDGRYFLLDSSGKLLYDLKDYSYTSFIAENDYFILEDRVSKTYSVINSSGDKYISFPINGEEDVSSNKESGFISIFYNNKNYVFNLNTGKEVSSFSSDKHYCINTVKEDGNIIILNSCVSWLEDQDKVYYKLIKNGKLYDLSDKCDFISFYNYLSCTIDSKRYILDSNLNLGADDSYKGFIDSDTYVYNKGAGVEFYKNGKVVNSVNCSEAYDVYDFGASIKGNIYLLKGSTSGSGCKDSSGKFSFYNSNGEKLFNRDFTNATYFDINDLSIVSDDGELYYLINKSGKSVSDSYSDIYLEKEYYIVSNGDYKGILDKNGKKILDIGFIKVELKDIQGKVIAVLKTDDGYVFYNLTDNRMILSADNYSYTEHYISYTVDDVRNYYTFKGKKFFELR